MIIRLMCLTFWVFAAGCGSRSGLTMMIVEGTVTCDGQKVERGEVQFWPLEGTRGPMSLGYIQNGSYRVTARGGVPLGKHQVRIFAEKKTGKQTLQSDGNNIETVLADEFIPIGSPDYRGNNSPLTVTLTSKTDRIQNFDLPKK